MTTEKDGDRNQIILNIDYDQNLSTFLKTLNNQIKMQLDITYKKKDYRLLH